MAQAPRCSLRAARPSSLTSPDPVRTPRPQRPPSTPAPTQDLWTSRGKGERQDTHALIHPQKTPRAGIRNETTYRNWPVD